MPRARWRCAAEDGKGSVARRFRLATRDGVVRTTSRTSSSPPPPSPILGSPSPVAASFQLAECVHLLLRRCAAGTAKLPSLGDSDLPPRSAWHAQQVGHPPRLLHLRRSSALRTVFGKATGQEGCFRGPIPSLALRAFMELGIIHEGLPVSREPALAASEGRMPKRRRSGWRSQHRVSEGQDARSERPALGARAAPNRGGTCRGVTPQR
jgi:hypothetical protein